MQLVRRIVDRFAKRHPLPEIWGENTTSRTAMALKIVKAACDPESVASRDYYEEGAGKEVPLQIGFSCGFAKAPDYFIKLAAYARKQMNTQSAIQFIIIELRDGTLEKNLSLELKGRTPSDKEIASKIMELRGQSFSYRRIGDARRAMLEEDEAIKDANIARHMEQPDYRKACRDIYGDNALQGISEGKKLKPLVREVSAKELVQRGKGEQFKI